MKKLTRTYIEGLIEDARNSARGKEETMETYTRLRSARAVLAVELERLNERAHVPGEGMRRHEALILGEPASPVASNQVPSFSGGRSHAHPPSHPGTRTPRLLNRTAYPGCLVDMALGPMARRSPNQLAAPVAYSQSVATAPGVWRPAVVGSLGTTLARQTGPHARGRGFFDVT